LAARTLVSNAAKLEKLRADRLWKKVLTSKETAKKIQDMVQKLDQSLATFQARFFDIKLGLFIEHLLG